MVCMSNDPFVIIGCGGHSLSIIAMVNESLENKVIGYTDLVNKGTVLGVSYLGSEELLDPLKHSNLLMGISYTNSPKDRSLRFNLTTSLENRGFCFPFFSSKSSIIADDIILKKGTLVFNGAIINTSSEIGEHAVINTGSVVEHGCRIGNQFFLGPRAVVCGDVQIGNNVFIGAGSVLKDSISVCDDVIIGMSSVVTKNITEPGVYIGNPAKKLIK
jgi:sugar O-acyltransferase (sialic acid O-acetyltransferase NeuD family)